MAMDTRPTRRQVLGAAGATLGGLAAVPAPAAAQSGTDLTGWFEKTSNATGVVDKTGQSEVTVTVGSSANGGDWGFGPAAVRVDPGATVRWEWTGKGGAHNVVASDGRFESELTDEQGTTFTWSPSEAGVTRYYCGPHKAMGMRGAVVAGDAPVTVSETTATPTPAGAGGGSSGNGGGGEGSGDARSFDGWLADTRNYDGVVDARGQEEVTVEVGADGNGGPFAFEPAGVHVSPDTTVRWEWVGPKAYDVVDRDLGIGSEQIASAGHTYAAKFDGNGLAKYTCTKYGDRGMRGVVLVGDGPVQELTAQGAAGVGGVGALVAGAVGLIFRLNDRAATTTDPAGVDRG
jgi:halocyanin-like protein